MYVFHYHPATHAYAGSEPCEFDQLEPGRVIVPAFATALPFPKGSLDQAGRWPFFLPGSGIWEVRDLPKPEPVAEPAAAPAPIMGETIRPQTDDEKRAAAALYLANAQRLLNELKAGA